jgi:PHD/YefM family antitoxin component YafN of YafNO toxin-antitoxin module
MTLASILLKAPHIGVRQFKARLSRFLKSKNPLIITDRGVPVEIVIPYVEALEMVDLIDEATDLETLSLVQEGRDAIKKGAKGISVERLFKKIRKERK